MSYAVLDDGFHGHPKILRGGPIVELLQLRAIAHCNRYLTDGLIEPAIIPVLMVGLERLEIDGTPAKDIDWVAALLELGLWERHSRGYVVHDYLAFNRSRQQVDWIKQQKRQAGAKGGQASAQARAQAPAVAPAQAAASIQPSAQAPATAGAQPSAQARHDTTRVLPHVSLRGRGGSVRGEANGTTDEPTDTEIRALIRSTAEKLGSTAAPSTGPPDDEAPPF